MRAKKNTTLLYRMRLGIQIITKNGSAKRAIIRKSIIRDNIVRINAIAVSNLLKILFLISSVVAVENKVQTACVIFLYKYL